MKQVIAVTLMVLLCGVAFAAPAPQATASGSQKKARKAQTTGASVAAQLDDMKQAIDAQQKQIQQLMQELQSRDQAIQQLQQQVEQNQSAVRDAQSKAEAASADTAKQEQSATALRSDVADLKQTSATTTATLQETQKTVKENLEDKLSDLAHGKVKIGATFYGDYANYIHTGFGPQFLTQSNQAGPGNDGFNSFDVTRTYINLFYTPADAVTLRITPNIYRQVDVSQGLGFGKGAAVGSSSNGNLGFRLKYAYVDFNTLFQESEAFKKDKLTFGQTTNPLVDWEEGLYGYRYVNLTPWNYLSLSSTYTGVTLHGPIEWNGKEYLDYHLGVFNTASFHAIEQNDKKQVMGRLTWYPMGTKSDRSGFGLTAFEDYGYNTKTPDTKSTPLNRLALIVHWQNQAKTYLIAGEYDLGRNAFSSGNLFSGVGPADEFGLGPSPFATFDQLARAILGGDRTRQQGFDFFGHARLGKSNFSVFGMYQYFQPNTNISGTNPLDFHRLIAGIAYKFNEHFEFAVDSQNLIYAHSQFTMPASQIATFSPSLAAANPNGIPNAVPQDTNAVFLNLLFNY